MREVWTKTPSCICIFVVYVVNFCETWSQSKFLLYCNLSFSPRVSRVAWVCISREVFVEPERVYCYVRRSRLCCKFCEFEPPSVARKERTYIVNIFYFNHAILQRRKPASLKTFQPHSVLWKEKSASENLRAVQIQCMFTLVLYWLPSRRKNVAAAQRSTGSIRPCPSSCPSIDMLLPE